jgi:AraC-like DNA-binding protein
MRNARTLGGIAAEAPESTVLGPKASKFDIRRACAELRELVERANLTNAALLAARRRQYRYEQERAYALHALKAQGGHDDIRGLYLREEPSLFSAIRAGDRGHAREVINRMLVALYHRAAGDLEHVKSLLLEMVVSMARTAVEAGGRPEAFLGANYAIMTELAAVTSEEALTDWLRGALNHLMDEVERHRRARGRAQSALFDALAYMERRLDEAITREDAARAAHLSPSHFSMLVRKETGVTFKEWLNRMRVDRAAELLADTDRKLAAIALECGFNDQSYFTKVFKRYRRQSPRQFRRAGYRTGSSVP